jgi:hypothetical protein
MSEIRNPGRSHMNAVLAVLAASLLGAPQATPGAPPPEGAPPVAQAQSPAAPPTRETLQKWGNEIGAFLLKGDTDAVALRFAPSLVAVLPPWRFEQGWHGIEDRNGKLRSVGEAELKPSAR